MSQYTAVYCDQQGLGCREIVLGYKICIVTKGCEAASLCHDTRSRHSAGRGVGRAGRGAQAGALSTRALGVRRCDTAAWGCDTAGGPGHDTAPVSTWARLGAPRRAGWAVCAHFAIDQFLTQYCF